MVRYRLVWVGIVFIMVGMVPWSSHTLVPWSPGVYWWVISASKGQNELGEKSKKMLK